MVNSRTQQDIERQLIALQSSLYEVGVLFYDGDHKPEMRTWTKGGLIQSLNWLKYENAELGGNIQIRPKGEHQYSVVDDLTQQGLAKMELHGYSPCCVVQTSADSFHAWVNHGKVLPQNVSTEAAKTLAKQFGGDPSAANWRHFGRLAGFTNRKPKHLQPNGLYPFCKLIEASGKVYELAAEFVPQVEQKIYIANRDREIQRRTIEQQKPKIDGHMKSIDAFRNDPRWKGDGHVADRAYAVYAADRGLPDIDIMRAILSRPDIAKKGNEFRQRDYAKRTVVGARKYLGKETGIGI